jgi:tetratricopeptide (TPR) repeat protein
MPVVLLLVLALAPSADARPQPARADSLPLLEMGNFLPAIRQQLQQAYAAAQAHPTDPEASGTLGMILDAYEQYDAAVICYRRAQHLDSRSFRWLFYLGWVQAAQGRHEQAAITLGNALRIQPGYMPAQLKLAESLFAIGRWEESRAIYQAVSTAHPESAEAHYGVGRVSAARGDVAAATTSYLKSVELFPEYGAAHYALALVYRKLGDEARYQPQFRLYEQNRTSVPPLDDPLRSAVTRLNMGSVAHIRRGADLERAGKIAEAIAEQQEALRVDPKAVQAHINLISLYGRLEQYEPAAEHYRAGIDLDRNQADLHYNYGVLLLKQRKPEDAETAFRATLEINPYYAEAHTNLGSLYEQQGRLDDAFQQFEEAVENRPNYRVAHFHMGRIRANQRNYGEAIQHFLKTLTPEDENTPRYLYALAATYARAGDIAEALKYGRIARVQAAARDQAELLASIDKDLQALEKR